jgi:hypothetical protein
MNTIPVSSLKKAQQKENCREQGYHAALRGANSDGADDYRADWKRAAWMEGFNAGMTQKLNELPRGVKTDKDGVRRLKEIILRAGKSK